MWNFKKEFKDKILFVRGYGNINTKKVDANDIYKMSLLKDFTMLAKYIEKDGKKQTDNKKSIK